MYEVLIMCKDVIIKNCSCVFFVTGLNTNTMEQDNPNYNIASNSAPRPAPTYFVTTNTVNGELGF